MKYVRLHVRTPQGSRYTTPQVMREADNCLTRISPAAGFECLPNSDLPIQEPDGTWRVRIGVDDSLTINLVERMIINLGLAIDHKEILGQDD